MSRFPGVLVLITLLAAALRLWGLDSAPPGLHPDEAANAYEAYCLWTTGASSDGRSWPFVFCMHGRFWVEGTYVWLVALAQTLPFSGAVCTRLPAALAGIALIPGTYCLAKRLVSPRAARVAAALLAVEPLAIHSSRIGLRASLVPALLTWALVLLLGKRNEPTGWGRGLAAGVLAALALWSYTPQRVWVPLLGLAAVLAFRRRVCARPLPFVVAGGCVVLSLLASLPWTVAGDGRARLGAVSVFAQDEGLLAGMLTCAKGYVLAFSPVHLFGGSSSRGFWAEGVTPLLWLEAPLIALGIGSLVARVRRGVGAGRDRAMFLLVWLLLHPIPSALTVPAPNPLRGIGVLPLWALLGAEGLRQGLRVLRLQTVGARRRAQWVCGVALALNACAAGHAYFMRFPQAQRRSWFAGQNVAIAQLLHEGQGAGAGIELECSWVEAALVVYQGRALNPVVERQERSRVILRREGFPTWFAVLSSDALVATEAGREVFRADVR